MKTLNSLGHKIAGDPISGEHQGVFQNPLTVDNGVRAYAASAYYHEGVAKRPNLHVLTGALVNKLVLEKLEDGAGLVKATGVQFTTASGTQVTQARKEVIVACGAIKSPQLLELSGIGDRELLSRHGIQVKVENPQVGENLQ